jgi:hypothetical protein
VPTPFSLVKLLVAACAPCPSWAVMLLVAVQYEHKTMTTDDVYFEGVGADRGEVSLLDTFFLARNLRS